MCAEQVRSLTPSQTTIGVLCSCGFMIPLWVSTCTHNVIKKYSAGILGADYNANDSSPFPRVPWNSECTPATIRLATNSHSAIINLCMFVMIALCHWARLYPNKAKKRGCSHYYCCLAVTFPHSTLYDPICKHWGLIKTRDLLLSTNQPFFFSFCI